MIRGYILTYEDDAEHPSDRHKYTIIAHRECAYNEGLLHELDNSDLCELEYIYDLSYTCTICGKSLSEPMMFEFMRKKLQMKQQRVLYVLQQSIFHDGKWISADSNINMMIGVITELLNQTEWEFMIVVGSPFEDINHLQDIFSHPRVKYHIMKWPVNAVLPRYTFYTEEWEILFKTFQPTILWNNIPELTRNFRALISCMDYRALLIHCNYWMDTPLVDEVAKVDERYSYELRQIDGALSADIVAFTCESTKAAFFSNFGMRINTLDLLGEIEKKSVIWDFGFSMNELLQYKDNPYHFDKPTFVFPNRLSESGYTHYHEFIDVVNRASTIVDFQVVFTNPSNKVSWEWLEKEVKPLHIIKRGPLTREEYARLLWGADFIVSLYTNERYGGCANVEGIFCNCLPIMPNTFEYEKRAPKGYPLFLEGEIATINLLEMITKGVKQHQQIKEAYSEWMVLNIGYRSSFEFVTENVIEHIQNGIEHYGF